MASVHILKPGLQTTVQDLGRWGFQSSGVPVAGAMDPFSHRLANALVGNAPDYAALEITLEGPELSFDDDRLIAVAGAEFSVTANQDGVAHARAVRVPGGTRVRFGRRLNGARAYLAISGGIDVPKVFASRSTHLPSRMGGWNGRALIEGDRLPLGRPGEFRRREPRTPVARATTEHDVVRVLPGPQQDRFQPDATDVLQSAPYLVTAESNRMGFRLRGSAIRHLNGADIISDATPIGSIQVPASGQPILLMADRQTTGGYPKLATVIAADLGIVAQRVPGESIRFKVCTRAEAIAALIAHERAVMAVESGS
jgi:antagonist of KipI